MSDRFSGHVKTWFKEDREGQTELFAPQYARAGAGTSLRIFF
jgi:hypothetical protein